MALAGLRVKFPTIGGVAGEALRRGFAGSPEFEA